MADDTHSASATYVLVRLDGHSDGEAAAAGGFTSRPPGRVRARYVAASQLKGAPTHVLQAEARAPSSAPRGYAARLLLTRRGQTW